MSEQRQQGDAGGIGDRVEVVLRDESGNVRQVVGKEGLRSLSARMEAADQLSERSHEELRDLAADEGIEITVEGGEEKKGNPSKAELMEVVAARRGPLAVGEVLFKGERQEIKGPGPEWEKDSEGRYVNR